MIFETDLGNWQPFFRQNLIKMQHDLDDCQHICHMLTEFKDTKTYRVFTYIEHFFTHSLQGLNFDQFQKKSGYLVLILVHLI